MFAPFHHNATFYDEATGPQPDYPRTYGPYIQQFQAEDATRILPLEYNQEEPIRDNMMVPSYQTGPQSTGPPFTMPGASGQFEFGWPLAPTAATQRVAPPSDDECGLGHPSPFTPLTPPSRMTTETASSVAPVPDMMSIEILSEPHDWSDETFTNIWAGMLIYAEALPTQWATEVNYRLQRQRGQPEPDLRAQLSGWGAKRECPSSTNGANQRPRKKRKPIDDETRDRAVAERETQELPVRRTLGRKLKISEPGHRALGMEALVVPPQGVSPTPAPGPVVTGATPGLLEREEAWTEGRGGFVEDPHDELETDEERWERLMKREGDVWTCKGCGGRRFADRNTLQKHCKSLSHGKERDMRKCPQCEKRYASWKGVKRHMREKHSQVGDGAM